MKLSRAERAALFEGDTPKIVYPGREPCPVAKGHIEVLSAHVRLEVTAIRRTKAGDHSLVYTLYNNRIGQRFLAVQDGQLHPEQYQHSGGSGIDPEAGEAVDAFTQRRITEASRNREREAMGELLSAAEGFREALSRRMESPDFVAYAGRDAWLVRSKLDRMVRNLRRRAA